MSGSLFQSRLRERQRDGEWLWQFKCPGCETWGDIDYDQLHGRVSIECEQPGCTFHETLDLHLAAVEVHAAEMRLRLRAEGIFDV